MELKFNFQPDVYSKLNSILNNREKRLPQTYLFYGQEGLGKLYYALWFIANIICFDDNKDCLNKLHTNTHPDVKIIHPENFTKEYHPKIIDQPLLYHKIKETDKIKIEEIRELKEYVTTKPFESLVRVILINYADYMTTQAANSFLKLLEEPSEDTIIILLATNLRNLLPTIISRIQVKIKFSPIKIDYIKTILKEYNQLDEELDTFFISSGSYVEIYDDLNFFDKEKIEFINKLMIYILNIIDSERVLKLKEEDYIKQAYEISKIIEKFSSSIGFSTSNKESLDYLLNKLYDILHKIFILNTTPNIKIFEKVFGYLIERNKNIDNFLKIKILEDIKLARNKIQANVNPTITIQTLLWRLYKLCRDYYKIINSYH